ncbi:HPP family protein [Sulfuricella sp.]|uniref:CBS domain-containing protein n=1 Tax=Sulfuricella sp. TaxID=2099377 RepID=UPI002C79CDEC|nr:CBS domain-containing protein [Sulfuricella sp.]HUX64979.1 CBS domain-containing protein [Sulfuricella sp.]
MFSIYGVTGQTFHGPLEQLIQVPGVMRAHHARGLAREGEEPGVEIPQTARRTDQDGANYEAAARAYPGMWHQETERGPLYHAYQIMSREVTAVRAESRIEEAWRTLVTGRIRQAPVLDSAHRLVGIVSERDLLTVLNVEGGEVRDVLARTVAEVMASPVVSADPAADIRRIASVLLDTGFTGVPVVNETGEMVGFVSRGDILRAVIADPPLSLWA